MKRKRKVIVVLRLAGSAGRDILSGVLLFARQRPHWHTRLFQMPDDLTPEDFRALADEGCDGVIMSEPGSDATAALLRDSTLPVAFIGDAGPILSARPTGIAYVRNDDREIGRRGARYLLSIGRRCSYGFVPTLSRQYWSEARHASFRDELAANGIGLRTFDSPGPSAGSPQDLDALRRWLESLPKPAAVMAAWDVRATQVIETASEAKIAVPRQLAVLGVDNDELLDESTVPPLTSIRPDHEKLGFVAARELERLMNGRPTPSAVKRLLATTDRPIKKVSVACGYADFAYLKTLFKRRFGMTMRDWRARQRPDAT